MRYSQELAFLERVRYALQKVGFSGTHVAVGWLRWNSPTVEEALRALASVGLAEQALAAGFAMDTLSFYDHEGHLLYSIPQPQLAGPRYPSSNALTRTRLHKLLQDAVRQAGVPVRVGVTVSELEQKEAAKLLQARYQYYQTEHEAVNQLIEDQLLEMKAAREHLTVQQLLDRDRVSAVAFHLGNKFHSRIAQAHFAPLNQNHNAGGGG